MKKILIAIAIFALLAIQAKACFEKGCPILQLRPPKIPIECPFLPKPRPPLRQCIDPPKNQPQPPVCRD